MQGVLDSTLNSKTYETIRNRLTVEEATASVSEGGGLQGISMKDSDEEDEEDLGWGCPDVTGTTRPGPPSDLHNYMRRIKEIA